jgi:hypothetical protein
LSILTRGSSRLEIVSVCFRQGHGGYLSDE